MHQTASEIPPYVHMDGAVAIDGRLSY